jgi:hypothetical protein
MIHLPWILFLIGHIGYTLYVKDEAFWFRNTNNWINDELMMLISGFVVFVGIVSSVMVYGTMLIELI